MIPKVVDFGGVLPYIGYKKNTGLYTVQNGTVEWIRGVFASCLYVSLLVVAICVYHLTGKVEKEHGKEALGNKL